MKSRAFTVPPSLVSVGLGLMAAVLALDPGVGANARAFSQTLPQTLASSPGEPLQEVFARCSGGHRVTCVVDGDTFWYRGEKIRVADINAPELSEPQCPAEARLAEQAARRFTALLNAGPFALVRGARAVDRYGRSLYVVARDGRSLGAVLTAEGLAEPWRGFRRQWC